MPAIAPPPLARPRIAPLPRRPAPAVPVSARSLADYLYWFALDVHTLRGRDVLDVGAGLSSFTAEACARKINAVAVDPIYGPSVESLAESSRACFPRDFVAEETPGNARRFESSATVPDVAGETGSPVQRFLSDYDAHFIHNRYVRASLPRLPFFDGTFDLVLCTHLLFTGVRRSDFDWTLAAALELVRVSAGEVRLYPLSEVGGRSSSSLPRLRRALKESGIESALRSLGADGESAPAGSTLVLRKVAA